MLLQQNKTSDNCMWLCHIIIIIAWYKLEIEVIWQLQQKCMTLDLDLLWFKLSSYNTTEDGVSLSQGP